jgi:hypothetical protein
MWLCSWLQTYVHCGAKSEHEAARIKAEVKALGTDESFRVGDVNIGARDLTGKIIEEIYIKVRPKYAVYRTTDRVVIQYADEEKDATEQRQHMSPLNLPRAQIDGLISDWTQSKYQSFKEKAAKYEGRVASALILCLEGDAGTGFASLNETKEAIIAERTSWGRFEYLISASIFSLIAIYFFSIVQNHYFTFPEASGNIWLAARAGTVGAFFSIALAIRNRTILTNLHRRDNLADAALRILIGIVAAGVLVLLLSSKILPSFTIGDAKISGTDITWQTVLVVGFVAGFLERLVPDLLEQTAKTPAADKAAADKAAADKAAADKAAADKGAPDKTAAEKVAAEKAAAEKTAAEKAAAEKAAAEKAAAEKATAEKAAAEKAAAAKAAAEKAAAEKAAAEKAAAEKAAADKVAKP